MRVRYLLIGLLFVIGCTIVDFGSERIIQDDILSQIKEGKTTKAEVKTLLGEPFDVSFMANGDEQWKYFYTRSKVKGTTYVPIVNLFESGVDSKTDTLTILISEEGIVKRIGEGGMGTTGGNAFD